MAAGASHSAVLLSWMTRRASVATAAAAARRLPWLLDAVAAAAKLVRSVCSFVSAPFQAVAMLGKVAGAMTTSESMETVAQRSNRGCLAELHRACEFLVSYRPLARRFLRWFLP